MVETFVGDEKKKKFVFITITGIESAQCCTYTTHVYVSCSGSRQFGLSLYLIDTRKRRGREREREKKGRWQAIVRNTSDKNTVPKIWVTGIANVCNS